MSEVVMEVLADTRLWSEAHFGTAQLGDRRRTHRLVESAAAIARHPQKPFTQVFDWNDLRGFYRLCACQEATLSVVQQPHWQQTRQAMTQQPLVLILHDTTVLDYTSHTALTGAGPIGEGNGQGFLQHNSLAVLPAPRQVLGLAYQQLRVRQPRPQGENTYQRRRRPRESIQWLEGIRAPGRTPAECCWVDVADRGCDFYEAMVAARERGHHFLFRVFEDRMLYAAADRKQPVKLLAYARSLPAAGSDTFAITGRGGRPGRTATVSLAAVAVWVPAPQGTPRRAHQPLVPVWLLHIWEPKPPAEVDEPVEWLLLCSLPTTTLEQLKERRDWYSCRWLLEVYHDVEKNGCSEEDRRFETAARLETCLAVLSVVAVRILQLRCALDNQANAPAEQVATRQEIEVVRRLTHQGGGAITVAAFVRGVARLGGFLGRQRDGQPGVRVLWRGYQRLQDVLLGFSLRQPSPPTGEEGP
jgi:Transposase DNA-binding/Transposase Tn5 dimerisation domain